MIKIFKNGKVELSFENFKIKDYCLTNYVDILNNLNFGLILNLPIVFNIELTNDDFYFILNNEEFYILNTKNGTLRTVKKDMYLVLKELYRDFNRDFDKMVDSAIECENDRNIILQVYEEELNTFEENINKNNFSKYELKKGNIARTTLFVLNNTLLDNSFGVVYDNINGTECFRLYTIEETYIILLRKKKEVIKIEQSLDIIAKQLLDELKDRKKMPETVQMIKELEDTLNCFYN